MASVQSRGWVSVVGGIVAVMAATTTTLVGHPVTDTVTGCRAAVADVRDAPLWTLGVQETRDALADLVALEAQLTELKGRLIVHGREVAIEAESGARTPGHWLAHATRQTRPVALAAQHLARSLESHPEVAAAMARGQVLADQARAICEALDALDERADWLDPDQRARAVAQLIGYAGEFDAKQIRVLGRRILEVVDPAAADVHEARLLAEEERRAEQQSSLHLYDRGDSTHEVRARVSDLHAALLRTMLHGLASPRHVNAEHGAGGYDRRADKPTAHRLGLAFCELLERYPTDRLPTNDGVTATIVVTIRLATLEGGDQAAALSTGERISPGQARRLACEAHLIPAVLGGESEVLDLGRARRLHTRAMRLARLVEQPTCEHPTCDVPATACHAHHREAWARGGTTAKHTLEWLCPHHHRQTHTTDTVRRT